MANEEDKLIKTETEVVETFEFKGIVFTKTTTTVKKADEEYPEVSVKYLRPSAERYGSTEDTDSLETMHARISRVASELKRRRLDFERALVGCTDGFEAKGALDGEKLFMGSELSLVYKGLVKVTMKYDRSQSPDKMIYMFKTVDPTTYDGQGWGSAIGNEPARKALDAYLETLGKKIKEAM